jgi:hypothetical protein
VEFGLNFIRRHQPNAASGERNHEFHNVVVASIASGWHVRLGAGVQRARWEGRGDLRSAGVRGRETRAQRVITIAARIQVTLKA